MSTVEKKISLSASQTQKMGSALAKKILKQPLGQQAVVIALNGELGSGKTCFLQGFAKGLGIKEKITSPTFVISRNYQLPVNYQLPTTNYQLFYHLDCYRIENPDELIALGFQKVINTPSNIIAIEWPEKIKNILPKNTLWLDFKFKNKNTRTIDFNI